MTNQQLLVVDGKVYATAIVREIDPQQFLDIMSNAATQAINLTLPPFPDNTRWYHHVPNLFYGFVVELRPGLFTFKHERWTRSFNVALPWQYFVITYYFDLGTSVWRMQTPSLLWGKNRVSRLTDRTLYRPELPNIFDGGCNICIGTTAPDSRMHPFERTQDFIQTFYSEASLFNDDLDWDFPNGYDNAVEWAKASRANPLCWMNWDIFDTNNNYSTYRLTDYFMLPQYDSNGNEIFPIRNLDDVLRQAQTVGRRPW